VADGIVYFQNIYFAIMIWDCDIITKMNQGYILLSSPAVFFENIYYSRHDMGLYIITKMNQGYII
jgi:hypothetical protein